MSKSIFFTPRSPSTLLAVHPHYSAPSQRLQPCARAVRSYRLRRSPVFIPRRSLAQLRHDSQSGLWSTSSRTALMSPTSSRPWNGGIEGEGDDHKPPDERIIKLGKTLRTLSSHLPNILKHPLPQDILSPSISLHLFPSTHPHLPTVKGRVPYRAALWTAPVAWGSVPIVGNVKLQVLSERMARAPSAIEFGQQESYGDEKLVVRWRTEGRGRSGSSAAAGGSGTGVKPAPPSELNGNSNTSASSSSNGTNRGLSTLLGGDSPIFKLGNEEQFSGLFLFSFDEEGRIASHTIEHADESNGWDRTAKVVTLTDWLLGKAKWRGAEPEPAFIVGNDFDVRRRSGDRR